MIAVSSPAPSVRARSLPFVFLIIIALASACSSIPQGGDPSRDAAIVALARRDRAKLGRVAVAPIASITLAEDEAAKGWRASEVTVLHPADVRDDVERALGAAGSWERVRAADADALADAWRQRDDVVLSVAIEQLRARFDGHNGWWIPNIVNFLTNTPAAWWVATEEYSLTLDVVLTLASAHSGRSIAQRRLPISVTGTMGDFDRGWQFFGPLAPSLDGESWRAIVTKLVPAAQRELAVAVALEADRAMREANDSGALAAARRKTLVLAVGVSQYENARAFPPLAYARDDGERVAETFRALGEPNRHVATLLDERATLASLHAAIRDHLGRALDGDDVVLTFAGYGLLSADGRPVLALHDARRGTDEGRIALDELEDELGRLAGRKLVVIDAGFGGVGRTVSGRAAMPEKRSARAIAPGLAVILAGEPGDPVLAPDYLGAGLLTHHLVRRLARLHVERRAGLGVAELFLALKAGVVPDAELLGARQTPRIEGLTPEQKLSIGARAQAEEIP